MSPKMKLAAPNGTAKHGFLNLQVAHPRNETKRRMIPKMMIGAAKPSTLVNSYEIPAFFMAFKAFSGRPPYAPIPIAAVARPAIPSNIEMPKTTLEQVFFTSLV